MWFLWSCIWASHFKILHQSFSVMGKALSGELYCMGTGLVCLHVAEPEELPYLSGYKTGFLSLLNDLK